jgi:alkylation response protein AidB-like acyl-CoA dehydrogenase
MNPQPHLDGYLSAEHPLSPRGLFADLPAAIRPVVTPKLATVWEQDTATLPRALAQARRRYRGFAEREFRHRSLAVDLAPHPKPGEVLPSLADLLKTAGREGMLTDLLPRPFGSASLGSYRYPLVWTQAIRSEELARVCGGQALLLSAHSLGVIPIVFAGDLSAIRRFVLPAYRQTLTGDPHLFAYAITEPSAGSDAEEGHGASVSRPGVVAKRVNGGWSLRGRKIFISGGDIAKSITVFAALENEGIESWTCFLLTNDMPGFEVVRNELKMGMRASTAAELAFHDVFVPDDHVVGNPRQGWAINRATLNASRYAVAGMAVGLAQGATEAAIDFACRTRLAGKSLMDFQEVQLQIANMMTETTAIRGMLWQAARKAYVARQDRSSMCKFHCTDEAVRVVEMALELMGNHGTLHDSGVEKIYRDVRLTQIFEGTNQINRLAVIEDQQEQFLARIERN